MEKGEQAITPDQIVALSRRFGVPFEAMMGSSGVQDWLERAGMQEAAEELAKEPAEASA